MTEWDGRPQNPERDGWHWMTDAEMPCRPWCEYWNGRDSWAPLGGTPDAVRRMWRYLGPCFTPAEAEAREAAARREGIEAAAHAAENCLHPSVERTAHAAVDDAVAAIRALLLEGRP